MFAAKSRCSGTLTHVWKLLKVNLSYVSKVNKVKKTLLDLPGNRTYSVKQVGLGGIV